MDKVRQFLEKINITGMLRTDEPMAGHTSFGLGGPADVYARPAGLSELIRLIATARSTGLPVFILGGGANILVADRGVRGLVVDMSGFDSFDLYSGFAVAGAGLAVSQASARLAEAGRSGLEFIYAMPGSTGGAVWMNARCYGGSMADALLNVVFLDENLTLRSLSPSNRDFAYKSTPFQKHDWMIIAAVLRARPDHPERIWAVMRENEADRIAKGHFLAPSAGSVFKNNRAHGAPAGVLIDRLGLKGFGIGGARVSPRHGNIIINEGKATAENVLRLVEHLEAAVLGAYGFKLERELLPVGDWQPQLADKYIK